MKVENRLFREYGYKIIDVPSIQNLLIERINSENEYMLAKFMFSYFQKTGLFKHSNYEFERRSNFVNGIKEGEVLEIKNI